MAALGFGLLSCAFAVAATCPTIDATYPVYSESELKVSNFVRVNGNTVPSNDYSGTRAITTSGAVQSINLTVPAVDPADLPNNSSGTDINDSASPVNASSDIFFNKVEVRSSRALTLEGGGPFHIQELVINDFGDLTLGAGVYYIDKFIGNDSASLILNGPAIIHIGTEFKMGDFFEANVAGSAGDFLVSVKRDATATLNKSSEFTGVIVGNDNDTVKIDSFVQFRGLVLSDALVEIESSANFTLTAADQSAIENSGFCGLSAGGNVLSHFVINHDGNGIHCLGEVFTVTAVDASGAAVPDFDRQITVDTQAANGSFTLAAGGGAFADGTAGDGLMQYTFDPADAGSATFVLQYPQGPSVLDLDSYLSSDSGIRDDDSEGSLVFAPSGFTLTRSQLSNPPPATINDPVTTQTAGGTFDVHIAAYGQSPEDPSCGIIESYTGTQNLAFWMSYTNPSSGSLAPFVDGSSVATSEGAATNQAVSFSSGQASVAVKYKDVGQIQLEVKDADIRGGTNAFVVRPADIVVTNVQGSGGTANPGATTMTGAGFVAAGEPFSVQVEVRDAEGSRTPNFGNEAAAEGIRISSGSLVLPVGGVNGSLDDGALGNATSFSAVAPAGSFRNTTTSWNETGVIRLQAAIADGDYLGTGNVVGTQSSNVGRFTPHRFVVTAESVSGSCGNQTYMDEPALNLSYEVEAQGLAANRLLNYDSALLGGAVAAVNVVAENADSGTDLSPRLTTPAAAWVSGRQGVTSNTAQFARMVSIDGPYASLQFGLALNDSVDGISLSGIDMNPATAGDCSASSTCTAQSIGSSTEMYYGRLEVENSFGPEASPLEVPLRATVFDGTNFVTNRLENCFSYRLAEASLSNYQDGLPVVTLLSPAAATPLSAGVSSVGTGIVLSSPGEGNTGSVDLTFNAPGWLEFAWSGASSEDPTGTVTFGLYRGHDRVIYWREAVR